MTVGILSWGAHKTLENTLESYARYGLPMYDDDRIIFFQQISAKDHVIAEKFGYKIAGSLDNVGIAEGYRSLVELAEGELFLFLENDWELITSPALEISNATLLLEANLVDLVKLRSRHNPGNPLWSRQFEGRELDAPQFLLDSIHWTDPSRFEPIKARTTRMSTWYTTTSRYANWSNNPHMARTEWLKKNILPQLGAGDIERHMQAWWQEQSFRVMQGEGLFTHNRLD